MKLKHLVYVPFTGLGLYGGFRGNRWLRNRITVFKQFVTPSLLAQTTQDYTLWVSWRPEERNHPYVKELELYLKNIGIKSVFTYHGVCFWDDKYSDKEAQNRLVMNLQYSLSNLVDEIGDVTDVLMTIQPSDDCYRKETFKEVQDYFKLNKGSQAIGFKSGYICNYKTLQVAEYNPKTSPPFYTIRFPKETFINPLDHMAYTGPYKSHEYVPDFLRMDYFTQRGFLVGTHTENISTHFNHPYAGLSVQEVLQDFGLQSVEKLAIRWSWRKRLLRALPHKVQRKLRYWFGELIYQRWYNFLRN